MCSNPYIYANNKINELTDYGCSIEYAIKEAIKNVDFDNIPELIPGTFKNEGKLLKGVYSGVYTPLSMYDELFKFQYLNIATGVAAGFGLPSDFAQGSSRYKSALAYKRNIELFSGAKTLQQHLALSRAVFAPGGKKRPFKEFQELALSINDQYNTNWLRTEQNAAFRIAQSAEGWKSIEDEADIFPLLEYRTVSDSRVRPLHAAWHGIVKPVNDPFWDEHYPPNDWACRCIVIQKRDGKPTNLKEHLKGYNKTAPAGQKISSLKNDSEVFANNAGKSGVIFNKKHPYNNTPQEFNSAKKNNFGFVAPSDEAVKAQATESFKKAADMNELKTRFKSFTTNKNLKGVEVGIQPVNFEGLTLEQGNSILKGLAESIGLYGVKVNHIGWNLERQRALAVYRRGYINRTGKLAGGRFEIGDAIQMQKTATKSVKKDAVLEAEAFVQRKAKEIALKESFIKRLQDGMKTGRVRNAEAEILKQKELITRIKSTKRWAIYNDAKDPLKTIVIHEGYHAIYRRKGLEVLFSQNLSKNKVTILDKFKVSEYGASSDSELFAEVGAAINEGISIPGNVKKAFEDTIKTITP